MMSNADRNEQYEDNHNNRQQRDRHFSRGSYRGGARGGSINRTAKPIFNRLSRYPQGSTFKRHVSDSDRLQKTYDDTRRDTRAQTSTNSLSVTVENKRQVYQRRQFYQKKTFDQHRFNSNHKTDQVESEIEPKLSIGETSSSTPCIALLPVKPYCKPSHLPDDVFNIIVEFVKNYFQCFDTNREKLLEAYNKNVLFSLSLNVSKENAFRPDRNRFEKEVMNESRNLTKMQFDDERCFNMLRNGHLDTVNCLTKLASTQHVEESFKLDVGYFSPHILMFTVDGVFKENIVDGRFRALRSFRRAFVCVPAANGKMNIANEQFTIAHITFKQFKAYIKPDNKLIDETSNTTKKVSFREEQIGQPLNENDEKIKRFSEQTNLNYQWTRDCLIHSNWNYEKAYESFIQLKNQIPTDAFLNNFMS